jgi:tetratricopeptide (TPR) repeat protein
MSQGKQARLWTAGLRRAAGIATASLLLLPLLCRAQQPAAPDAAKSQSSATQKKGKQAAGKTDAPVSDAAAPDAPRPDAPAKADPSAQPAQAPAAGANAPQTSPDAAADNPFPEDVSRGAAAKAAQGDSPDAPAPAADAGSSSSSSSSGSANPDAANGTGSDPNAEPDVPASSHRRRLGKPRDKDIQAGSLTGQARAEEDVKVGRYYLSQRDYGGAYARFSEAARLDPVNVEAIYGVAASAEGLHKTDEALENYKLYLQIAPDGEHARAAEKSLKTFPK